MTTNTLSLEDVSCPRELADHKEWVVSEVNKMVEATGLAEYIGKIRITKLSGDQRGASEFEAFIRDYISVMLYSTEHEVRLDVQCVSEESCTESDFQNLEAKKSKSIIAYFKNATQEESDVLIGSSEWFIIRPEVLARFLCKLCREKDKKPTLIFEELTGEKVHGTRLASTIRGPLIKEKKYLVQIGDLHMLTDEGAAFAQSHGEPTAGIVRPSSEEIKKEIKALSLEEAELYDEIEGSAQSDLDDRLQVKKKELEEIQEMLAEAQASIVKLKSEIESVGAEKTNRLQEINERREELRIFATS